jgi:hypothetical protein
VSSVILKAIHQKYDWIPKAPAMQIVCRNAGRHCEVTRSTGHCVPTCVSRMKSIMKAVSYIEHASLGRLGSTLVAALFRTPNVAGARGHAAEDRAERVSFPVSGLGNHVRFLTP